MERWALQVAHSSHKRGITEIHPAVPIIDRISPFQVHGIHLDTVVNISQIVESFLPILTSPGTELGPKMVVDRWERHETYTAHVVANDEEAGHDRN